MKTHKDHPETIALKEKYQLDRHLWRFEEEMLLVIDKDTLRGVGIPILDNPLLLIQIREHESNMYRPINPNYKRTQPNFRSNLNRVLSFYFRCEVEARHAVRTHAEKKILKYIKNCSGIIRPLDDCDDLKIEIRGELIKDEIEWSTRYNQYTVEYNELVERRLIRIENSFIN